MDRHEEAVRAINIRDEQFYSAIGRFISEFSLLEMNMKGFIAAAVGKNAMSVIMPHDFSMTCTIAQKELSSRMDESQAVKLRELIARCRKLNDERVRIAHGFWLLVDDAQFMFHMSRQKLVLKRHYAEAYEVAALADEAEDIWYWLGELVRESGILSRSRAGDGEASE